jgi:hypothetical protein
MPTFRSIIAHLTDLPRGFSADGRAIGLGLDAALKAQRATGADVRTIRPAGSRPVTTEVPESRAS